MANSGGGQFAEDVQYQDKYGPPPGAGRKRAMEQGYGGGELEPEYPKRGRFEDRPPPEADLDRLDVPPATLRVLVRQIDAGGIIGKGGENIKRLRKVHDCQVILPDSPGAPERVMTIMGRIEGCVGVLRDCLPKLGDGPVQQHGDPGRLAYETQVLIPQPFMGTIIGTGGTKIKELRSRTKTSIKIFSDPMPNSNERSVQLIGTEEQITDCTHHFLDEISKKEPREPIFLYEPTAEFSVPPPADFPPPPRRGGGGPHYRPGGMDRSRGGRGGGGGWRGGGGRGGGGGGDRPSRGRGYQGSWRGRSGPGGNSHQPPFQPPPNQAPPMGGGSSYGHHHPPHHMSGSGGGGGGASSYGGGGGGGASSYGGGGQTNVGYSSQGPPPSMAPSTSSGQAQQMYMQQSAPSSHPPPSSQLMPPPGQQTQQVTIPNEYAVSILGVNGANLEHIKSQSSCDILINDPKPGSSERIINITGSPSNIQLAQTLMQNSVRQYHSV